MRLKEDLFLNIKFYSPLQFKSLLGGLFWIGKVRTSSAIDKYAIFIYQLRFIIIEIVITEWCSWKIIRDK